MQRASSLEKTLMLGKIEGRRRRGQQRTRWLDGITDSKDMSKLWEMVKYKQPGECSPWGYKGSDTTEQLNNNTLSTAHPLLPDFGPGNYFACVVSCFTARQYIKKQRHYFANKSPSSKSYGFSSSHVWM